MGERIVIEGIGGIGGIVAGAMIDAGLRPVLVTNNAEITAAIRAQGLGVTKSGRTFTVQPTIYTTLADAAAEGPFDAAYLGMKALGVVDAATETLPYLAPNGYVVTFQNGIVEDAVGEAVGIERVVSGSIGWNGIMHSPGVYERTTPGEIFVGELNGTISPRVEALAKALDAAGPVKISANMRGVLWSKLAINCTVNSVGALTGDTLGELLADKRVRGIFLLTYSEVVDVAEAQGIALERIAANPKLLYVGKNAGPIARTAKDFIVRMLGRKYKSSRSSTLQSLERGRKTEIDFLNGYVVGVAKTLGIDVPLNAALTAMIKEIEAGTRKIAKANVEDLVRVAARA